MSVYKAVYVSEVSFYNYDIEYKQKNGKIFGE